MTNAIKKKQRTQKVRALRVRKKLKGTSEKPRLSVHKSNQNIYAQLINDETGQTLASFSSLSKEIKQQEFPAKSKASAQMIGEKIAELALAKNIKDIVFDRGRFSYHGIIAAIADAARSKGLQF